MLFQVLVRVALVALVVHAFPQIYTNDAFHFWNNWHTLGVHHLPYRNFLWEFPPLTVVPVAAAALFSDDTAFAIFLGVVMASFELATLEVLCRCRPKQREGVVLYWTAAALPIGLLAWFRFDFMSVLFAALALLWIQRRRPASAWIVLGVFSKLWPGVVLASSAWRTRWREVVVPVAVSGVLLVGWYAFSTTGFRAFLDYRKGTGFHVESLIGSLLLLAGSRPIVFRSGAYVVAAGHYGWVDSASLLLWIAVVVTVVGLAYRKRSVHDAGVLGVLVIALMLASRLFSPQYLVWVLPFAVLARADGERLATTLLAVCGFLTTLYLLSYAQLLDGNRLLAGVVVLRNLLLVVTAVALFRWAWSYAGADEPAPAPQERSTPAPHRT